MSSGFYFAPTSFAPLKTNDVVECIIQSSKLYDTESTYGFFRW